MIIILPINYEFSLVEKVFYLKNNSDIKISRAIEFLKANLNYVNYKVLSINIKNKFDKFSTTDRHVLSMFFFIVAFRIIGQWTP